MKKDSDMKQKWKQNGKIANVEFELQRHKKIKQMIRLKSKSKQIKMKKTGKKKYKERRKKYVQEK